MDLRQIITMLRSHWLGIVALSTIGVALGIALTVTTEPQYRAQNTVIVSVLTSGSIEDLQGGATFASRQVQTLAEVARSPKVLGPVAEDLGLEISAQRLRSSVTTSVKGETALIEIAVTRTDPQEAADIADTVAAELSRTVSELFPPRTDGSSTVVVTTISPAVVPNEPFAPSLSRNLAMGLLLGFVLGLGWAVLRTTLDTKVRTEADARALTDVAILGAVSYDSKAANRTPTIVAPALSIRAEEYRQLRTNLQFVDAADSPRTIVVTSSRGGEGKSVTSVNLALAIAESGVSVCLVDADLRRPSVSKYLGLEGTAGLTTVLIGQATLDDVLQPVGDDGLHVLTSGRIPPNPSELLGSAAMQRTIEDLLTRFDMVLFDSAPLLPVTDSAILSKSTDGVLLVVGGSIVSRDQVLESLTKLDTIGSRKLGIVVNRAQRRRGDTKAYGYRPHRVELDHADTSSRLVPPVTEADAETPAAAPDPEPAADAPVDASVEATATAHEPADDVAGPGPTDDADTTAPATEDAPEASAPDDDGDPDDEDGATERQAAHRLPPVDALP